VKEWLAGYFNAYKPVFDKTLGRFERPICKKHGSPLSSVRDVPPFEWRCVYLARKKSFNFITLNSNLTSFLRFRIGGKRRHLLCDWPVTLQCRTDCHTLPLSKNACSRACLPYFAAVRLDICGKLHVDRLSCPPSFPSFPPLFVPAYLHLYLEIIEPDLYFPAHLLSLNHI